MFPEMAGTYCCGSCPCFPTSPFLNQFGPPRDLPISPATRIRFCLLTIRSDVSGDGRDLLLRFLPVLPNLSFPQPVWTSQGPSDFTGNQNSILPPDDQIGCFRRWPGLIAAVLARASQPLLSSTSLDLPGTFRFHRQPEFDFAS